MDARICAPPERQPSRKIHVFDQAENRFVRASGQPAAIGALTDAAAVLAGRAGTTISPAALRDGPATPVS